MVVDNSVEDSEHRAAKDLVSRYSTGRVRYYRNEPELSLTEKCARRLEIAETDLVAIAHGDDEVLPWYAEEFVRLAEQHPEASVLFTMARIIDKDSRYRFSFTDWFKKLIMPRGSGDIVLCGEQALRSIARGNWIFGGAVCYRKSLLGDLRWDLDHYLMTADLEFWSRVILSGKTLAGSRRPAYLYRRHSGQTTARMTAQLDRFREESRVLDVVADRASEVGWASASEVARSKHTVQLNLLFLAVKDVVCGMPARARQKLQLIRDIRRAR